MLRSIMARSEVNALRNEWAWAGSMAMPAAIPADDAHHCTQRAVALRVGRPIPPRSRRESVRLMASPSAGRSCGRHTYNASCSGPLHAMRMRICSSCSSVTSAMSLEWNCRYCSSRGSTDPISCSSAGTTPRMCGARMPAVRAVRATPRPPAVAPSSSVFALPPRTTSRRSLRHSDLASGLDDSIPFSMRNGSIVCSAVAATRIRHPASSPPAALPDPPPGELLLLPPAFLVSPSSPAPPPPPPPLSRSPSESPSAAHRSTVILPITFTSGMAATATTSFGSSSARSDSVHSFTSHSSNCAGVRLRARSNVETASHAATRCLHSRCRVPMSSNKCFMIFEKCASLSAAWAGSGTITSHTRRIASLGRSSGLNRPRYSAGMTAAMPPPAMPPPSMAAARAVSAVASDDSPSWNRSASSACHRMCPLDRSMRR